MLQNVVEPRNNANKNAYQRRVIDVIGPASTGRFFGESEASFSYLYIFVRKGARNCTLSMSEP